MLGEAIRAADVAEGSMADLARASRLTSCCSRQNPQATTMSLIYYLTHVHIDFGTRSLLASECERVGIRKPLIVTDAGVRAAGVLQMVLDALDRKSVV